MYEYLYVLDNKVGYCYNVVHCNIKHINAWATKRAGCKVREPTQNARAHAKCADPRKVHGPTQSARAALWVQGTPSARTRAKCVGRGSIARAALSARAAIAWRGEWAALPTHLPRTCHSMPTQCNRGSTRVGRDEPQSPGTLRVKNERVVVFASLAKKFP